MKLRDITNSECDVRKYMSIEIPDEVRYELENWDYDVDDVLGQARIYIDKHKLDDEIIPFNVEKNLELNPNQQIVLDWFKAVADYHEEITPFDLIELAFSYERLSQSDVDLEDKATDLAFNVLNDKEQFQVLAAFAEWGMKGGNKTSDKKSKKECEYSILEKWLY